MKKLTVYKTGKRVEMANNKYYVIYGEHNNREIKNDIQITFITNFMKKRDIKHYDKYRMAFVLEKLNEYSERYNETMKEKDVLDSDKLYRILKSQNNGYYGQVDIKQGRKVVGTGWMIDKPLTEEQTKQLEKFNNCKVENKKSIYVCSPEIKKSIVWIMKK